MAKLYDIIFDVKGSYPFPDDMLRYDGAEFLTEADRVLAEKTKADEAEGVSTIRLISRQVESRFQPTYRRWESFNWRVDPASLKFAQHNPTRRPEPAPGGPRP